MMRFLVRKQSTFLRQKRESYGIGRGTPSLTRPLYMVGRGSAKGTGVVGSGTGVWVRTIDRRQWASAAKAGIFLASLRYDWKSYPSRVWRFAGVDLRVRRFVNTRFCAR